MLWREHINTRSLLVGRARGHGQAPPAPPASLVLSTTAFWLHSKSGFALPVTKAVQNESQSKNIWSDMQVKTHVGFIVDSAPPDDLGAAPMSQTLLYWGLMADGSAAPWRASACAPLFQMSWRIRGRPYRTSGPAGRSLWKGTKQTSGKLVPYDIIVGSMISYYKLWYHIIHSTYDFIY